MGVGNITEKVLNDVNAVLNLSVSGAEGANALIKWVKKFDLWSRSFSWMRRLSCAQNLGQYELRRKERIRYSAFRQAKQLIGKQLRAQALNFSNLPAAQRNEKLNNFLALTWGDLINSLLNEPLFTPSNANDELCSGFCVVLSLRIGFGMLAFLGLFQNLDYVIASYEAGRSFIDKWMIGFVSAFLHA